MTLCAILASVLGLIVLGMLGALLLVWLVNR